MDQKWHTTPFQHFPPSEMQTLFGKVVHVPALLEEIDNVTAHPDTIPVYKVLEIRAKLELVLHNLTERKSEGELSLTSCPSPQNFRFPSLLAANVNTHVWAFQIVCLREINRIDEYLSRHTDPSSIDKNNPANITLTNAGGLAVNICRSIDFLLQDELKLYGPASALFPLKIAFDLLNQDAVANAVWIARCEELVERLDQRGYPWGPHWSSNRPTPTIEGKQAV
jgi:hypothetical protein